jgi:thiol:disulfide interchange protein DsbA
VKVVHIPATFRADFMQYAKAYYAAEALGIADKTHRDVYEAIHIKRTIPAEGDSPTKKRSPPGTPITASPKTRS